MIYDFLATFLALSGMILAVSSLAVNSAELKERTMNFALRSLRVCRLLRRTADGQVMAAQLSRCATSVAANYRAALRGKSPADFINKVTIVLEEADESEFWLEVSVRSGLVAGSRVQDLRNEAIELVRIFSATRRTALRHQRARLLARRTPRPPNHKS